MNVYVYKNQRQMGPFTAEELRAKADRGEFATSDYAWMEGWSGWQALENVPGFSDAEVAVFVHKSGAQHGPLTLEALLQKTAAHELAATDPAWIDGWPEWRTIADVPGFVPPLPSGGGALPARHARGAPAAPGEKVEPYYFYVPAWRLVGLSVLSCNLYVAYWFYRNWRYANERHELAVMPFWRAVFWVIFAWPLLGRMSEDEELGESGGAGFSAPLVGIGLVATLICEAVQNRTESLYLSLALVLAALSRSLWLLPVQNYVNRANRSRAMPPRHAKWTVAQIVIIILGMAMWAAIAVASVEIE